MKQKKTSGWQFWIDRGGTFTDVVARHPDGSLLTRKLLSDNPERYEDAALQAIRDLLDIPSEQGLPLHRIEMVKMGTTVATNALLQRQGERTVLAITQGFADALLIRNQDRPRIFDLHIVRPDPLYEQVIEIQGRVSASGQEIVPLDLNHADNELRRAFDDGIRSCAIVLMHGYCYPEHELQIADLARRIGFSQVSVSHQVSPLQKLIGRGETTVADAYLSPVLSRYVRGLEEKLKHVPLLFMQSNGGLTTAKNFQGKNSILSGPAGGIVGAVRTSAASNFDRIIAFDMGGTSTDVALYNGAYERTFETTIAGVHMHVPMMNIHTVAAGGGSICHYSAGRYRVGPDSAGANPGPASYRRGGPLTVSDCNLVLGRLHPEFFPNVFGTHGNQSLDVAIVRKKFMTLAEEVSFDNDSNLSPYQVAEGFLRIAVENMANAIKKVSMQRGHHASDFTLCCFGGAGAQHVCRVADGLDIKQVIIHPYAGVLSAYGIGLADLRLIRSCFVGKTLSIELFPDLQKQLDLMVEEGSRDMRTQISESFGGHIDSHVQRRIHLHYAGSDSNLELEFCNREELTAIFTDLHQRRYGFSFSNKALIVESLTVEIIGTRESVDEVRMKSNRSGPLLPISQVPMFINEGWHNTPVFDRQALHTGDSIEGPAMITEALTTTIVESGWHAIVNPFGHLLLSRLLPQEKREKVSTETADPMLLELFNNLFMSIAEQMGNTLANTAHSVNIKERLDFSCALFDQFGQLIANAPHMPVHLGSMGESVQSVIRNNPEMAPGDVFVLNAPYNGGTHLPDLSVVTPVFDDIDKDGDKDGDKSDTAKKRVLFFVASRGHHADIGGISPGSMPPASTSIEEEGIVFNNFKLVEGGLFHEQAFLERLQSTLFPARNPEQNVADVQAQVAANNTGVQELHKIVHRFGLEVVQAYMKYVQDHAEECVRRALKKLSDGEFKLAMDDGSQISVSITIDHEARQAHIDFGGTSDQRPNNFNAPKAICTAAVLYVFRTLIDEDIPLNAGCLKPLHICIPEGSMLDPSYPAAVVAGNVETSQSLTDALYGALGILAASQGTMNNFSFGDAKFQYYETIAGGSGAGPGFDGCSGVQTHMTNSRLTDPEVLEWRFPVLLQQFSIRRGSGGRGRYCGGDGVLRRIEFLAPMNAAILANRRKVAPFGLQGGSSGQSGRSWVERSDGTHEELASCAQVNMQPGDVFVIETPGGGGYGTNK